MADLWQFYGTHMHIAVAYAIEYSIGLITGITAKSFVHSSRIYDC